MGFLFRKFLGGKETEAESILRNLGYVLSAKRGAASVLPDFGLTDLGASTPERYFNWLDQEVRHAITRFEPRVEIVEVEEDAGEDGHPRIRLVLRVRSTQENLRLLLDPARRELAIAAEESEED